VQPLTLPRTPCWVAYQCAARPTGLVDEAFAAHAANERELLSVLTKAEQKQLDLLLTKLLAGIGKPDWRGGARRAGAIEWRSARRRDVAMAEWRNGGQR